MKQPNVEATITSILSKYSGAVEEIVYNRVIELLPLVQTFYSIQGDFTTAVIIVFNNHNKVSNFPYLVFSGATKRNPEDRNNGFRAKNTALARAARAMVEYFVSKDGKVTDVTESK